VVGNHVERRRDLSDFEQFIVAYPLLLDKGLPVRHRRRETLYGDAARATWVEPDLLALPS